MNLKEKRAGIVKAAQAVIAAAKGRDLTDEETADLTAKQAELAEVDALIEKAEKSAQLIGAFAGMGRDPEDGKGGGTAKVAKSLGDHFIGTKGDALKAAKGVSGASVSASEWIPTKAAADTQARPASAGAWATDFDTNIVTGYRRPLVIADLLSSGTLSGNAITYLIEGALEGDFQMVAEGGAKPQIHFAGPTTVTETLKKIAAFIKFTDEMIEDFDYLVANINNRGLYQLGLTEEAQILNGDGTGQNLLGLLNRAGVQNEASANRLDNADAVFRGMTKVQLATGFTADGVAVHPLDYQTFRLSKDGNGQYYGGGFFQGQYGNGTVAEQPPLWGLRTVVTPAIPQGTVAVAAWKQLGTVYRKGGIRVETTNSHANDFTNNLVTTRIEERLALESRFPAALCKVALSSAAPA